MRCLSTEIFTDGEIPFGGVGMWVVKEPMETATALRPLLASVTTMFPVHWSDDLHRAALGALIA